MPRPTFLICAGFLLIALAGCEKTLDAPTDRGVCWHLVEDNGKPVKFNRLADNQPDLEHCAGQLERMRRDFNALGAGQSSVTGAYQGQFLFLQPDGVFTADKINGFRYPMMIRAPDGSLVVPGAVQQQH